MAKRKAVGTKVRFEIFKRDGFKCQYCGSTPPAVILHVDHIVPVKEGGGNEDTNLITSCDSCNLGKGATPLCSAPRSLAERAAETAEREAQIKGYSEVMRAKRLRIEDDAWDVAEVYTGAFCLPSIPRSHLASVKRFLELLDVSECLSAMESACAKKCSAEPAFKYFCGICWNIIKGKGR
jgi:hypothetical protein